VRGLSSTATDVPIKVLIRGEHGSGGTNLDGEVAFAPRGVACTFSNLSGKRAQARDGRSLLRVVLTITTSLRRDVLHPGGGVDLSAGSGPGDRPCPIGAHGKEGSIVVQRSVCTGPRTGAREEKLLQIAASEIVSKTASVVKAG